MRNGMFVPATQCKSHPNVKSDGKARVDTGKTTLTQQGIDVDKFISDNHALIEKLRKGTRKNTKNSTTGRKKETMTTTSKITADDIPETKLTISDVTTAKLTPNDLTTGITTSTPQATANPRAIISNALTGIFDAISALQKTAFQTNDKVVYGFATKLLNGELMDLKANYSKDTAK